MKVKIPPPEEHTLARYSYVLLRTEDWTQIAFVGKDGKEYKLTGYIKDEETGQLRCPTEKCKAMCCRFISLWNDDPKHAPCPFIQDDHLCNIHARGGIACKPVSCLVWPRQQSDIDHVNELYADGEMRCYLKVEEV